MHGLSSCLCFHLAKPGREEKAALSPQSKKLGSLGHILIGPGWAVPSSVGYPFWPRRCSLPAKRELCVLSPCKIHGESQGKLFLRGLQRILLAAAHHTNVRKRNVGQRKSEEMRTQWTQRSERNCTTKTRVEHVSSGPFWVTTHTEHKCINMCRRHLTVSEQQLQDGGGGECAHKRSFLQHFWSTYLSARHYDSSHSYSHFFVFILRRIK